MVGSSSYAKMTGEDSLQTPVPGAVVGGKYRILRPLGEGGMGAVFETENVLTLKRAAIKWLHPRMHALEEASKRLVYEARACARVRHRNVVDVYDVVLEAGSVFLVMELLAGESLADYLRRETIYVHELVQLLIPAMRGVAAAHAVGVVHRDIKPENIFLARERGVSDPLPKVIDFGISLVADPEYARLTRSGMTMGTPRYVSYEQLRGARDVDARADVYSFGVMLYECIVGRAPYEASSLGEQAISFVTTEPPRPRTLRPELPEELEALLLSSIARERDERIPTMDALIEELTPFADPARYTTHLLAHPPQTSSQAFSAPSLPTTGPASAVPSESQQQPIHAAESAPARPRRWPRGALGWAALGASCVVATAIASWSGTMSRSGPPPDKRERPSQRALPPRTVAGAASASQLHDAGKVAVPALAEPPARRASSANDAHLEQEPAPLVSHPAALGDRPRRAPRAKVVAVPAPQPVSTQPSVSNVTRRADPLSREEF